LWYWYARAIHENSFLTSLKHVSKYQDVIHENKLPHVTHECDSGNEMLSMKKIYIASLLCVTLVPKWYPWKLATWHSFIVWYRSREVFHENKLPCISSVYDTGFKVSSMKINYLASFKHKHNHKHQKRVYEN
jgi:hypothetical protein